MCPAPNAPVTTKTTSSKQERSTAWMAPAVSAKMEDSTVQEEPSCLPPVPPPWFTLSVPPLNQEPLGLSAKKAAARWIWPVSAQAALPAACVQLGRYQMGLGDVSRRTTAPACTMEKCTRLERPSLWTAILALA